MSPSNYSLEAVFQEVQIVLDETLPLSYEADIAFQKMQEVIFWSNQALEVAASKEVEEEEEIKEEEEYLPEEEYLEEDEEEIEEEDVTPVPPKRKVGLVGNKASMDFRLKKLQPNPAKTKGFGKRLGKTKSVDKNYTLD